MNDVDLLRRHEPVVRFTAGEMFFPRAVDAYVEACSLWTREPDGRMRVVVPAGALDLDRLAVEGEAPHGRALHLRFVEKPLSPREYQQWRRRPHRVPFSGAGRLSRVTLWARLLDTGFDIGLLLRGTVPGGTSAAAEVKERALRKSDDRYVYYGRVSRDGGWTVLQYLFFYAMNDWRSNFHGTNDHEADWEQILVYLYETNDGALEPRWAAFASHNYSGNDVRRRWDDPLLKKEGLHPVVFVGAGSHASYFEQGEYVMGVEPGFLAPVRRFAVALRRFWVETLGQGNRAEIDRKIQSFVSVPFVDYARGDGPVIGPGAESEWTPIPISGDVPWVNHYRGLWGLDTQDRFGGENAPGGPKYNSDGSVRPSWYDPVGWAGLDRVLPPPNVVPALEERQRQLTTDLEDLDNQIARKREALERLSLDELGLRETGYSSAAHKCATVEVSAASAELRTLKGERSQLAQTRDAVACYAARARAGLADAPASDAHRAHRPAPPARAGGMLHLWAAFSGAIALLAIVVLIVVSPPHWWLWAVTIGFLLATVEAAAEGRLVSFLLNTTVVLALITSLILIRAHWRLFIVVMLGLVIALMIRDNLRELAGNRASRRAPVD